MASGEDCQLQKPTKQDFEKVEEVQMSSFSAVIMAGGSGTRFWPKSRRLTPKQTLPFLNGESLLQRTVSRLSSILTPEDFLIVTGADQLQQVKEQLPHLPESAFIGEPAARNTAPCVALAAHLLAKKDEQKPMVVLASDHFIAQEEKWLEVFSQGAKMAAEEKGRVVVFGVQPTRAHTGFGYVKFDQELGNGLFVVSGFREKPDQKTAESYLAEGCYYWNSGCFAWRPDTLLELVAEHMPELHTLLKELSARGDSKEALAELYPQAPSISVDYGIMERCSSIKGLILDVGWNDVGAWPSLFQVLEGDDKGTINMAQESLLLDCEDSLFSAEDQLIAAVGVKDLIVVQSQGVILVCPRSEGERVKELVAEIKARGRDDLI